MEIDIKESITYMQDRYSFRVALAGAGDVATKVNRDALTIDDVILIETGEAEGHGFSVEEEFLSDLVKYVRKELGGRLPSNMGHQWDALMFQLGRFDKLRLSDDGRRVIAKMTCYEAADRSPAMPGMLSWFLDMAEKDPKSVMCSITFVAKGFYQYDDKGSKVYVQATWWGGPKKQFEDKPVYAEFGKIYSCDIVAAGALTSTLFSAGSSSMIQTFKSITSAPGFAEWMSQHEHHFPALTDYYERKQKFSLTKYFKSIFSNHKSIDQDMEDTTDTTTQAPAPAATPAPAAPAAADTSELDALREQVKQLQATNASQEARIKELGTKPAAQPVPVIDQNPGAVELNDSKKKSYEADPVTLKARKLQEQMSPATK